MRRLVLEFKPKVVSFHFGMPEGGPGPGASKDAGLLAVSSATTAEEARWLEDHGCDVVIAQGNEAGGHRGMFLTDDIARQPGTMALVPQVRRCGEGAGDRRRRDRRRARHCRGAGARRGRAWTPAWPSRPRPRPRPRPLHRAALKQANDNSTTLTNVFTGRPARGIVNRYISEVGPMSAEAPQFPCSPPAPASRCAPPPRPRAGPSSRRCGAARALTFAREMPTGALIAKLVEETEAVMKRLG